MYQAARRFEPGTHLRELELNRLIPVDRLAELLAFAGVPDRFLQRSARPSERKRPGNDPDLGKKLAQMGLAVPFLPAQAMAVRYETVIERKLGGWQCPYAHLGNRLADVKAGEVFLQKKYRKLALIAGASEHRKEIGHWRRSHPHFLTFEAITAFGLHRCRRNTAEIAARVRLGHADGPDLLPAQRRNKQAVADVVIAEQLQKLSTHERLHGDAARK